MQSFNGWMIGGEMLLSPDQRASHQHAFWTRLRHCWSVFWKVTASATAALFLLFMTFHNDDFREPSAQTLFAALLVFGYCLFYAACGGVAAVAFAMAWRYWGPWILLPLLGALAGAIAFVGLGIGILALLDLGPARAGVHGGGQIAAILLLVGAAISSLIGAAIGGIAGALVAVLLGLSPTRRSGSSPPRA